MDEAERNSGAANEAPAGADVKAAPGASGDSGQGTAIWHHPVVGSRRPGSTSALFRKRRQLLAIYLRRRLDPAFRETIMFSVAVADECRQCGFAHRTWAMGEGVPETDLDALVRGDLGPFDARTRVAIAWAQAYARSDLTRAPEDIAAEFGREFSPLEQADIGLVVREMYWLNEISNGADAAWSRVHGSPTPGSSVISELRATVAYAITVPVLILLFSLKLRTRPLTLLRSMGPFFRGFALRG